MRFLPVSLEPALGWLTTALAAPLLLVPQRQYYCCGNRIESTSPPSSGPAAAVPSCWSAACDVSQQGQKIALQAKMQLRCVHDILRSVILANLCQCKRGFTLPTRA